MKKVIIMTAKELASILNISAATVSMVFNDKPGISEETRELVLQKAKEHGYQPNKKLVQQSNSVIHFVIYKKSGNIITDTPFFSQLIEGVNLRCQKFNCTQEITYVYNNESLQKLINTISKSNNSGIILLATEISKSDSNFINDIEFPIVLLDNYLEDYFVDSVVINNTQGAYLETKHLIENGHKKIGYLQSSFELGNFNERQDGYYKALLQHNIPIEDKYICPLSPTGIQSYEDMNKYLSTSPELPTAYFADSDQIAISAIRSLKEHGVKVPEDVSIIGFDDIPTSSMMVPGLTTMRVPKQNLGSLAVDRVLKKIQEPKDETIKIEVSTTLIERQSVKRLG